MHQFVPELMHIMPYKTQVLFNLIFAIEESQVTYLCILLDIYSTSSPDIHFFCLVSV